MNDVKESLGRHEIESSELQSANLSSSLKRNIVHSLLITLDGVSHCPLVRVVAKCNWRTDNLKLIKLKTVFSLVSCEPTTFCSQMEVGNVAAWRSVIDNDMCFCVIDQFASNKLARTRRKKNSQQRGRKSSKIYFALLWVRLAQKCQSERLIEATTRNRWNGSELRKMFWLQPACNWN